MKKKLYVAICVMILVIIAFVIGSNVHLNKINDIVGANVEALAWQETPNGIIYECTDTFCIIFKYKNRVFNSGCKYSEEHTCTVQAWEFPDININL